MADRPLPQIRGAFCPAAVRAPPSNNLKGRGGVGLEVVHGGGGEPGCWSGPEAGVGRPLGGDQACGSQGVGGGAAGGTRPTAGNLNPIQGGGHGALRSTHVTHHVNRVLQLKDQAGGAVSQRSTLCPWNVAAGSPTWILLEFPQSHHPTTTAIAVTFIPASRKPVRSQKPSQLQSKWPHLPISTCHSCSLSPAGVGLPQAQVPWVLAPRTPLPAVIGLVLPWPEATVPAVCSPRA